MTSPVADSYSALSGKNIFGGMIGLPSWRKAMTANTWVEIPSNTLEDINPRYDPLINSSHPNSPPWYGTTGFRSIVAAWCGGCYDEAGDTLWLPLGGGHADYAGNEPYKIDLNAESPAWEMVRNPSGAIGNQIALNDGQEATGLYSDGRPRAIHSYNKPVYVPNVGPVIAVQGNCSYSAAGGTSSPIFIDPISGEMTLMGASNPYSANSSGGGGCYDPSRHAIWFRGAATGQFAYYDIAANTWTAKGSSQGATGSSLTYLPDHDCLLWTEDSLSHNIGVFDCATGVLYEPTTTGAMVGGIALGSRAQPRLFTPNSVAMWNNSTDTTSINTLSFASNPRTDVWTIDQLAVSGSNTVTPTSRAVNGTYGRFFYSPVLDGFGVVNSVYEPIYFYART